MNRTLRASLGAAVAFVLAGCSTPSLNGIPESARVRLDGLEGVWISDDTVVHIEESEDTLYLLKTAGFRTGVQLAIAQIDGKHVADATIDEDSAERADEVLLSFVIPVHKFAHLDLEGDTLKYVQLDEDWIGANAAGAGLAKVGDANVLTGDESQVLSLLTRALKDEDAWDSRSTFTRLIEGED